MRQQDRTGVSLEDGFKIRGASFDEALGYSAGCHAVDDQHALQVNARGRLVEASREEVSRRCGAFRQIVRGGGAGERTRQRRQEIGR